ncbi:translation initiation factor IF-2 N-terminal domain-containing protein, partial [Oceanobacillus massiliensis]
MSKMRVYEYAKQNNTTSKDVINYLTSINVEVSNHMSTISDDTVKKLNEKFSAKPKQSEKTAKPAEKSNSNQQASSNSNQKKPQNNNQGKNGNPNHSGFRNNGQQNKA